MSEARGPILVMGTETPVQRALVRELRSFSLATRRARDFRQANTDPNEGDPAPSVLLLAANEIHAASFEADLAELRVRTGAPRLVPIAFGSVPSDEQRLALRQAGVDLALFGRFGRHALRFQVNRARARFADRQLRGELRAPQEWRTRAFSYGKAKGVRCYSLSTVGGYFVTPRPWVVGSDIVLELPIGRAHLRIDGRVLYTNVAGAGSSPTLPRGMAVQFRSLSDHSRRLIRAGVTESQANLEV
jgi:hypothetical protein